MWLTPFALHYYLFHLHFLIFFRGRKNKPPGKAIRLKIDAPLRATSKFPAQTGTSAAHQLNRLMLLGSPPDMVHSRQIRWNPSFNTGWDDTDRSPPHLKSGHNPRYSGFRVQESATLPACMTLPRGLLPKYYTTEKTQLQYFFQFSKKIILLLKTLYKFVILE